MTEQSKGITVRKTPLSADDPLGGFLSEAPLAKKSRIDRPTLIILATSALVVGLGAATGLWLHASATGSAAPTGLLQVESDPSAEIAVDGTSRGKTPLNLEMVAGQHQIALSLGGRTQHITVTVAHNTATVHHISWPVAEEDSSRTSAASSLRVVADAGARVSVDGVDRGAAPLTISDLRPGSHDVTVKASANTWRNTVMLERGETASLVLSKPPTEDGAGSGWLSTRSAIPLQIFEGGKLIGSSDVERIMMTSGQHSLDLANDALGFKVTRAVQVPPGKMEVLTVDVPQGALNINAIPWAQVWIDGKPLGETPIGNTLQPIGTHELIFRHPDLGERRVRAVISLKDSARVSVDMRKQ